MSRFNSTNQDEKVLLRNTSRSTGKYYDWCGVNDREIGNNELLKAWMKDKNAKEITIKRDHEYDTTYVKTTNPEPYQRQNNARPLW